MLGVIGFVWNHFSWSRAGYLSVETRETCSELDPNLALELPHQEKGSFIVLVTTFGAAVSAELFWGGDSHSHNGDKELAENDKEFLLLVRHNPEQLNHLLFCH